MKYIKLYFTYAKCSLMGKLTYKANVMSQNGEIGVATNSISQTSNEVTSINDAVINDIVHALKQADLPASEANIEDGKKAYEAAQCKKQH